MQAIDTTRPTVRDWAGFDRHIRYRGVPLFGRLGAFETPILVSGCQRSGTTILSHVISDSPGVSELPCEGDSELHGALVLCGHIDYRPLGRHCFQTTYINNRVSEYLGHDHYRLVWVLRNPFSVVYSMLHNWRRAALTRLFFACGREELLPEERRKVATLGCWTVGRTRQACLSYNAKVHQLLWLSQRLGPERLLVVDYDELVQAPEAMMAEIREFLEIPGISARAGQLLPDSVGRSRCQRLREALAVETLCISNFNAARRLLKRFGPAIGPSR